MSTSAIKFSNEQLRPAADKFAQLYYFSRQMIDTWEAQGVEVQLGDFKQILADGAEVDGRPVITVQQVVDLVTQAKTFVSEMEANNKQLLNTVLLVAVNTRG